MITTKQANDILIQLESDLREAITAKVKALPAIVINTDEEPVHGIKFESHQEFEPDKSAGGELVKGIFLESSCDGSDIMVIAENYDDDNVTLYNLSSEIWTASDLLELLTLLN